MQISIHAQDQALRRPKPDDESHLVFGKIFSDHMFVMDFLEGKGWHDARIVPHGRFEIEPVAMVLHYGQGIFEGLKAYRRPNGKICLFRPDRNWERFNDSAYRMCMPQIEPEFQTRALEELLKLDRDWVPHGAGSSLYIRPAMIATEPHLGVRASREYVYFIVTGPVAAYYSEGFNPVKIYVSDEHARSVRGGLGEAKTMSNYAASLFASEMAKKKGFTQVLWLDGAERRYVEEVGTSNIFFRIGDELVTPALTGSILQGVTRDSVIRLAEHRGITCMQRAISIDEVIDAVRSGDMKEMFATGTAAVISPVGEICYKRRRYTVGDGGVGDYSRGLYDEITGIQYGGRKDIFGWIKELDI